MTKELEIAYPRLCNDWQVMGGLAVRLRPPGVRGVPDFMLLHPCIETTLCEVKSVQGFDDRIGIAPAQWLRMKQWNDYGAHCIVLCWCISMNCWGMFGAIDYNPKFKECLLLARDSESLFLGVQNVALGNSESQTAARGAAVLKMVGGA